MQREITITSLNDIPGLVSTFATDLGFTVAGSSSAPIVQRPDDGTAISFLLQSTATTLKWSPVGTFSTQSSTIASPQHLIGTVFTVIAPTKVILVGSLTPQPWIAIVVAFGFNLYRHLYLGHMEKIGDYVGGEVISSDSYPNTSGGVAYNSGAYARLFASYQNHWSATQSGGVHIGHADNPTYPWRNFSSLSTAIVESSAYGGFGDNVNDAYLSRGRTTFNGANLLTPINLLAGRTAGNVSPIGRPPGVRLVRLDGIDPETTITISSDHWRCFPMCVKSDATAGTVNSQINNSWTVTESSWIVGYAYKVD